MADQKAAEQKILDAVEERLNRSGYAAIKVKGGEMFFFNEKTLEKLLETCRSSPDGRVAVFVQTAN